eukprot:UC4_evm9s74
MEEVVASGVRCVTNGFYKGTLVCGTPQTLVDPSSDSASSSIEWMDHRHPRLGPARTYKGGFYRGMRHHIIAPTPADESDCHANSPATSVAAVYKHADGTCYEGGFKKNMKHGPGHLTLKRGTVVRGMFENNTLSGPGGEIHFPGSNGLKMMGTFSDGKLEGDENFIQFPDGGKYKGAMKKGLRHGYGIFKWPDGEIYDGEWYNDRLHGDGSYTWPDGRSYSGGFNCDQRHGEGVYISKNGDKFCGTYVNDRRIGFGISYYHDGSVDAGIWRGMHIVKIVEPSWIPEEEWRSKFPHRLPDPRANDSEVAKAFRGHLTKLSMDLHNAAADGNYNAARTLLRSGKVHPDVATYTGQTGLHVGTFQGKGDIMSLLLEYGADINLLTDAGTSVLLGAYLLSFGYDPETAEELSSPEIDAVGGKSHIRELMNILLEKGADPNVSVFPEPILFRAVKMNDAEMVELVLKQGAKPNYKHQKSGLTPLHEVCLNLNLPKPSNSPSSKVLKAHRDQLAGEPLFSKILVEKMKKKCIPFRIACTLLEYGADPNIADSNGRRPLHIVASQTSRESTVFTELLLFAGANPNLVCNGNTPLSLAIRAVSDETIDVLLVKKADVNVRLANDHTALKIACSPSREAERSLASRKQLVEKIVSHGSDPTLTFFVRSAWGRKMGTVLDCAYRDYVQNDSLKDIKPSELTYDQVELQQARQHLLSSLEKHMRAATSSQILNGNIKSIRCCEECGRMIGVKLTICAKTKGQPIFICSQLCKIRTLTRINQSARARGLARKQETKYPNLPASAMKPKATPGVLLKQAPPARPETAPAKLLSSGLGATTPTAKNLQPKILFKTPLDDVPTGVSKSVTEAGTLESKDLFLEILFFFLTASHFGETGLFLLRENIGDVVPTRALISRKRALLLSIV